MKRTGIARTGPITRTSPMKKRKTGRSRAAFDRAYGGADRADWMTRQPCVVCGALPSVNAHVKTGGAGRKADAKWVVPACRSHHDEMHRGQRTFEAKYGVDLARLAAIIDARWEVYRNQIDLFTPRP